MMTKDISMQTAALTPGSPSIAVVGGNRSVLYAAHWLKRFGANLVGVKSFEDISSIGPDVLAVLIGGDAHIDEYRLEAADQYAGGSTGGDTRIPRVWLWDYEVGRPGVGSMASAVSGVSAVIGEAEGPPQVLPAYIPEKWCGIFGASMVFSIQLSKFGDSAAQTGRIDVSSADILRAWAEQNSGNHAGVPYGWRRNGQVAVEHGGVFPQGFFPCKDGYIAIQARSRQDWMAILASLSESDWTKSEEFHDPFKLSEDDSVIRPLLEESLATMTRRDLLNFAISSGAPMAPVLSAQEARTWDVFRPEFVDDSGSLSMPFSVKRQEGTE